MARKVPKTASAKIRARVSKAIAGWVFTPSDFLDLGTPQLVGMALLKLVRSGQVRRLARGIYDVPRRHPKLGALSPAVEAIADAVARRDGTEIEPSESAAANILHLTEQVPAKPEYQSDLRRSKKITVGNVTIRLKSRSRRKLGGVAPASRLVFSGLRNLGRRHVTDAQVRQLHDLLSAKDRKQLLVDLPRAPRWMRPLLQRIAASQRPSVRGTDAE